MTMRPEYYGRKSRPCVCGKEGTRLCDYRKCDASVCEACVYVSRNGGDRCPAHGPAASPTLFPEVPAA
jgi:hypothetical protein